MCLYLKKRHQIFQSLNLLKIYIIHIFRKRNKKGEKNGKGLRHFSMKVCEKVQRKGTTSYNEVADELVAEFTTTDNHISPNESVSIWEVSYMWTEWGKRNFFWDFSVFPTAKWNSSDINWVYTFAVICLFSNIFDTGIFLINALCLQQAYDQKNIRRRVYDALNVLMAMNIISKEKKEIKWIGLPTNSAQECQNLEVYAFGSSQWLCVLVNVYGFNMFWYNMCL